MPAVSHLADQLPPSWPQPRLVFSFPSESEPASSLDWVHRDFEKRGVSVGEQKVQRGWAYRVDAPHTVARSMTSPSIRRDRRRTNESTRAKRGRRRRWGGHRSRPPRGAPARQAGAGAGACNAGPSGACAPKEDDGGRGASAGAAAPPHGGRDGGRPVRRREAALPRGSRDRGWLAQREVAAPPCARGSWDGGRPARRGYLELTDAAEDSCSSSSRPGRRVAGADVAHLI